MDSPSNQPSTSSGAASRITLPLQSRDALQNHVRQNFKLVREQGRKRAEELDQKRLRAERELKEMEDRARVHREKKERELKENAHIEPDLTQFPGRDRGTADLGLGPSGSVPDSMPSSLPVGLMDWDKISGTHARLSAYLSNIGKLTPIPEKEATKEDEPEPARRPESSSQEKEMERAKMKELLAAYLSQAHGKPKPSEAPKKKSPKVYRKSSILARLAAPTHSSLAKQTKKWNGKEDTSKATKATAPPAATGSTAACSKSTTGHDHADGCICARHTRRFPEFKP